MGWVEDTAARITSDRNNQHVLAAILLHGILIPLAFVGFLLVELVGIILERFLSHDPGVVVFILIFRWLGYTLLSLVAGLLLLSIYDSAIFVGKRFYKKHIE